MDTLKITMILHIKIFFTIFILLVFARFLLVMYKKAWENSRKNTIVPGSPQDYEYNPKWEPYKKCINILVFLNWINIIYILMAYIWV